MRRPRTRSRPLASIGVDKLEEILGTRTAALAAEVMAEAMRNPDVCDMFYRNQTEARGHVVAALRRGQAKGTVDPALDLETACQLIMAMGDGLVVHQKLDPTLTPARFRPVLQQLLRRFLRPPVIALLGLLVAASSAWAQTPHPPSVSVVSATVGSIAENVVLTGTLVPREEVLVSPQLDALAITEVLAEEGDRVAANQVLARLSHDVLDATIAQNVAQVARAEAAVAQARSTIAENQANRVQVDLALTRTRELLSNGNASRETFEQRQASASMIAARIEASQNALREAEADVALARAQGQELQVRLARTDIRAPVGGIVSRRTARLGSVVAGSGGAAVSHHPGRRDRAGGRRARAATGQAAHRTDGAGGDGRGAASRRGTAGVAGGEPHDAVGPGARRGRGQRGLGDRQLRARSGGDGAAARRAGCRSPPSCSSPADRSCRWCATAWSRPGPCRSGYVTGHRRRSTRD